MDPNMVVEHNMPSYLHHDIVVVDVDIEKVNHQACRDTADPSCRDCIRMDTSPAVAVQCYYGLSFVVWELV